MKHSNTKPGYYHSTKILKAFSYIILLLVGLNGYSQYKISGNITTASGDKLSAVTIYGKWDGKKYTTDDQGKFVIEVSSTANYDFLFYKEDYSVTEKSLSAADTNIAIQLESINNLSEVVINKQKEKLFAVSKLKDIDETAIYAGKKTEVISLSKITANKATNNARQVYAQIVGLTINESSDGGLQLSIGGRGLDPNRTSNFNTRQNGYDISADVLGYPESYYSTPTEALEEIQIVRGAASLQYGTQFGGLVNFKLKSPTTKPFELVTRNTIGSYGLYTNFTSLSGTNGKLSYYSFFNFKEGHSNRPNSHFNSKNFFANVNYQFTDKTSLHFDYTYFTYLAQQPGGLSDAMFYSDPTQSNRTRNWFTVNWNLFAVRFKHKFANEADFSLQLFGLDASRKSLGYRPDRVSTPDEPGTVRDLIIGDFVNWGAEARYLQSYSIGENKSTFLLGAKYYQARNTAFQGPGSSAGDADFHFATDEFPLYKSQSDFAYPNLNIAFFGENIFKLSPKFSITPGFRLEKIRTKSLGSYRQINVDNAGNVILDKTIYDNIVKDRHFVLVGVGMSYKPKSRIELYGNVSQNYRSVTFSDIHTVVSNQEIDPNITDEKGFTTDIGIRGQITDKLTFDASAYGLFYNDKIGDLPGILSTGRDGRLRKNIGDAVTYGVETMVEWNISKTLLNAYEDFSWTVFSNIAITKSEYVKSDENNVEGNDVEFVPLFNIKTGTGVGYKNFQSSLQFTQLSSQFTDASNRTVNKDSNATGVFGEIPSYYVADLSVSYKWRNWKLEAGINNFTDNSYFTRRATGYPGPGIIPSDMRTFYSTLEFKF